MSERSELEERILQLEGLAHSLFLAVCSLRRDLCPHAGLSAGDMSCLRCGKENVHTEFRCACGNLRPELFPICRPCFNKNFGPKGGGHE